MNTVNHFTEHIIHFALGTVCSFVGKVMQKKMPFFTFRLLLLCNKNLLLKHQLGQSYDFNSSQYVDEIHSV